MTEVDSKNPGHELKTSRERLGLSINDVAVATKINPRILKALEDGDRSGLPAKSFARGFIRSYANYLKIDPSPILVAYDGHAENEVKDFTQASENKIAAIEVDHFTNSHSHSDKMASEEPRTSSNKVSDARARNSFGERSVASRIVVFAVIFVLVGLVIFVKKVKDKYEREKVTGDSVAAISAIEPDTSKSDSSADGVAGTAGGEENSEAADVTPPGEATATITATDKNNLATSPAPADSKPDEKPSEKAAEKTPEVKAAPTVAAIVSTPASEKISSDKLIADKVATEKMAADKAAADKVIADKAAADKIKADKAAEKAAKKAAAAAAVAAAATSNTGVDSNVSAADVASAQAVTDKKADAKPSKKSQEIIIEALDAVDVTIQVDGEAAKKVHLNPEMLHTIKAKGNVEVEIADGGMVNIVYNGLDKGVPGQLGKPIKLKYP